MVTVSLSTLSYTMQFVDSGVKVVVACYCDLLLSQQLLLVICQVSGESFKLLIAHFIMFFFSVYGTTAPGCPLV